MTRRTLRTAWLAAGLLWLPGVNGAQEESGEPRPVHPRILETVSALAGEPGPRGGKLLAVDLAEEPLELFHALASLQYRASESYLGELEEYPGAKHVLLTAFGHLGRDVTLGCLDELAASGSAPSTSQYMAAITLARFFDHPDDYLHLARFVEQVETLEDLHPRVNEELVRLFAEAFSRSARARESFLEDWLRWGEGLGTILVRASLETGRPETGEDLVLLLGTRGDLDPTLLYTLCSLADELPRWAREWAAAFVARSLWEDEVHLLRAATTAVQHFPSGEVIRPLISLLSHEDAGVRIGAHRALGLQTGLRFPANARMWNDWLRDQDHWYSEEAPELLLQLSSPDRAEVTGAMRRLALHQLHRDELSEELVVTLYHEDPFVRRAGCEALSSMHAWPATDTLVEALDDEDAGVRAAAHRALMRITGLDMPSDQQPWESWLEERGRIPEREG